MLAWMSPADAQHTRTAGGEITLLGQLILPGPYKKSDVWGWVDPATSKEYAIVGEWGGPNVYVVDVSDPTSPTLVKTITSTVGQDLKTWQNYLYVVDGDGSGNDGEIWNISNPMSPTFAGNFLSAHNIFIDDRGYMYNEVDGLVILDLNGNPTTPAPVWFDRSIGGHDATVVGNRLYDFHGQGGTHIYDVTDPTSPVLLGTIADPDIQYHHSGWPSSDGEFLYLNDELAGMDPGNVKPDITVWNISDPATPFKVDDFGDPDATVHNSIRVGDYLFVSYYVAGFRVFDVSNPSSIVLADEYDTSAYSGEFVFEGCWGVYPLTPSGNIYASDMDNGLFVFSFFPDPTGVKGPAPSFVLEQNVPNPFNPTTTIRYQLSVHEHVVLGVYDVQGRLIRTLVEESQDPGPRSVNWDGRDGSGQRVASGVYFYRLEAGPRSETKRMILLK